MFDWRCMTDEQRAWLGKLLREKNLHAFYVSRTWRRKRKEVILKHQGECQPCKRKGRHSAADTVHHWFHLDEYPEYALEEYVLDEGVMKKNLEPFCHECHELEHDNRHEPVVPLTEERW